MKKQEAILRMMIPMANSLFEKRAEWDEIDQKIDACGELYDRIATAYPEEEDEDDDDFIDDDLNYGGTAGWDEELDEQLDEEMQKFKNADEIAIIPGKFDEKLSKEEASLIDSYMEKEEQYIPYVEETIIKSKGSIL